MHGATTWKILSIQTVSQIKNTLSTSRMVILSEEASMKKKGKNTETNIWGEGAHVPKGSFLCPGENRMTFCFLFIKII